MGVQTTTSFSKGEQSTTGEIGVFFYSKYINFLCAFLIQLAQPFASRGGGGARKYGEKWPSEVGMHYTNPQH